ncbi:hypothetical protein [Microbacterium pseudoresistens]|uniref:Uncharacterized protein n=1 Tax=Microbacterium pseudoresistens TaxID=640634 RepID=A0A7Y9ETB2_9MICO|nr:hypothetical protein [Microbacterium pseudoresistens]NYD53578.1 hypothetical protein [Microbacterium pseudoresistens]
MLITVKASPQPSAKYGDTVCVAGIRVDGGRADWIRLYPLPFRWMGVEQQFKKFDLIEVEVRRESKDTRPESYRPNIDSINIVKHLDGWKERQPYMERVARTSTCALSAAAVQRHDAPSLGMVTIKSVERLRIEPFGEWTDAQKARIAEAANLAPLSLFGDVTKTPAELKAPRFVARYEYHCTADGCPGHVGQILDWELTALQGRSRHEPDASAIAQIEQKFHTQMFAPGRQTSFFMGNFEDARKRHSFSVLGVYYPPEGIATSVGLFDLDQD